MEEEIKYVKCIRAASKNYTVDKIYIVHENGYIITNKGDHSLTKLTSTATFCDKTDTDDEDPDTRFSGNSDFTKSCIRDYNIQEGILEPVPKIINEYSIF